jgi:hypothetical protein
MNEEKWKKYWEINLGLQAIFEQGDRISYVSKKSNLYPHQSRITLYTLLSDTLYIETVWVSS